MSEPVKVPATKKKKDAKDVDYIYQKYDHENFGCLDSYQLQQYIRNEYHVDMPDAKVKEIISENIRKTTKGSDKTHLHRDDFLNADKFLESKKDELIKEYGEVKTEDWGFYKQEKEYDQRYNEDKKKVLKTQPKQFLVLPKGAVIPAFSFQSAVSKPFSDGSTTTAFNICCDHTSTLPSPYFGSDKFAEMHNYSKASENILKNNVSLKQEYLHLTPVSEDTTNCSNNIKDKSLFEFLSPDESFEFKPISIKDKNNTLTKFAIKMESITMENDNNFDKMLVQFFFVDKTTNQKMTDTTGVIVTKGVAKDSFIVFETTKKVMENLYVVMKVALDTEEALAKKSQKTFDTRKSTSQKTAKQPKVTKSSSTVMATKSKSGDIEHPFVLFCGTGELEKKRSKFETCDEHQKLEIPKIENAEIHQVSDKHGLGMSSKGPQKVNPLDIEAIERAGTTELPPVEKEERGQNVDSKTEKNTPNDEQMCFNYSGTLFNVEDWDNTSYEKKKDINIFNKEVIIGKFTVQALQLEDHFLDSFNQYDCCRTKQNLDEKVQGDIFALENIGRRSVTCCFTNMFYDTLIINLKEANLGKDKKDGIFYVSVHLIDTDQPKDTFLAFHPLLMDGKMNENFTSQTYVIQKTVKMYDEIKVKLPTPISFTTTLVFTIEEFGNNSLSSRDRKRYATLPLYESKTPIFDRTVTVKLANSEPSLKELSTLDVADRGPSLKLSITSLATGYPSSSCLFDYFTPNDQVGLKHLENLPTQLLTEYFQAILDTEFLKMVNLNRTPQDAKKNEIVFFDHVNMLVTLIGKLCPVEYPMTRNQLLQRYISSFNPCLTEPLVFASTILSIVNVALSRIKVKSMQVILDHMWFYLEIAEKCIIVFVCLAFDKMKRQKNFVDKNVEYFENTILTELVENFANLVILFSTDVSQFMCGLIHANYYFAKFFRSMLYWWRIGKIAEMIENYMNQLALAILPISDKPIKNEKVEKSDKSDIKRKVVNLPYLLRFDFLAILRDFDFLFQKDCPKRLEFEDTTELPDIMRNQHFFHGILIRQFMKILVKDVSGTDLRIESKDINLKDVLTKMAVYSIGSLVEKYDTYKFYQDKKENIAVMLFPIVWYAIDEKNYFERITPFVTKMIQKKQMMISEKELNEIYIWKVFYSTLIWVLKNINKTTLTNFCTKETSERICGLLFHLRQALTISSLPILKKFNVNVEYDEARLNLIELITKDIVNFDAEIPLLESRLKQIEVETKEIEFDRSLINRRETLTTVDQPVNHRPKMTPRYSVNSDKAMQDLIDKVRSPRVKQNEMNMSLNLPARSNSDAAEKPSKMSSKSSVSPSTLNLKISEPEPKPQEDKVKSPKSPKSSKRTSINKTPTQNEEIENTPQAQSPKVTPLDKPEPVFSRKSDGNGEEKKEKKRQRTPHLSRDTTPPLVLSETEQVEEKEGKEKEKKKPKERSRRLSSSGMGTGTLKNGIFGLKNMVVNACGKIVDGVANTTTKMVEMVSIENKKKKKDFDSFNDSENTTSEMDRSAEEVDSESYLMAILHTFYLRSALKVVIDVVMRLLATRSIVGDEIENSLKEIYDTMLLRIRINGVIASDKFDFMFNTIVKFPEVMENSEKITEIVLTALMDMVNEKEKMVSTLAVQLLFSLLKTEFMFYNKTSFMALTISGVIASWNDKEPTRFKKVLSGLDDEFKSQTEMSNKTAKQMVDGIRHTMVNENAVYSAQQLFNGQEFGMLYDVVGYIKSGIKVVKFCLEDVLNIPVKLSNNNSEMFGDIFNVMLQYLPYSDVIGGKLDVYVTERFEGEIQEKAKKLVEDVKDEINQLHMLMDNAMQQVSDKKKVFERKRVHCENGKKIALQLLKWINRMNLVSLEDGSVERLDEDGEGVKLMNQFQKENDEIGEINPLCPITTEEMSKLLKLVYGKIEYQIAEMQRLKDDEIHNRIKMKENEDFNSAIASYVKTKYTDLGNQVALSDVEYRDLQALLIKMSSLDEEVKTANANIDTQTKEITEFTSSSDSVFMFVETIVKKTCEVKKILEGLLIRLEENDNELKIAEGYSEAQKKYFICSFEKKAWIYLNNKHRFLGVENHPEMHFIFKEFIQRMENVFKPTINEEMKECVSICQTKLRKLEETQQEYYIKTRNQNEGIKGFDLVMERGSGIDRSITESVIGEKWFAMTDDVDVSDGNDLKDWLDKCQSRNGEIEATIKSISEEQNSFKKLVDEMNKKCVRFEQKESEKVYSEVKKCMEKIEQKLKEDVDINVVRFIESKSFCIKKWKNLIEEYESNINSAGTQHAAPSSQLIKITSSMSSSTLANAKQPLTLSTSTKKTPLLSMSVCESKSMRNMTPTAPRQIFDEKKLRFYLDPTSSKFLLNSVIEFSAYLTYEFGKELHNVVDMMKDILSKQEELWSVEQNKTERDMDNWLDLLEKNAKTYKNNPKLFLTWMHQSSNINLNINRYVVAGNCEVVCMYYIFNIIKEFKEDEDIDAFDVQVVEELFGDFLIKPEITKIANHSCCTLDALLKSAWSAIEDFHKGEPWFAHQMCQFLMPYYSRTGNNKMLEEVHATMSKVCADMSKRSSESFFFVSLGDIEDDQHNFVYSSLLSKKEFTTEFIGEKKISVSSDEKKRMTIVRQVFPVINGKVLRKMPVQLTPSNTFVFETDELYQQEYETQKDGSSSKSNVSSLSRKLVEENETELSELPLTFIGMNRVIITAEMKLPSSHRKVLVDQKMHSKVIKMKPVEKAIEVCTYYIEELEELKTFSNSDDTTKELSKLLLEILGENKWNIVEICNQFLCGEIEENDLELYVNLEKKLMELKTILKQAIDKYNSFNQIGDDYLRNTTLFKRVFTKFVACLKVGSNKVNTRIEESAALAN
ncbi:hypothetical protein EIN_171920 [Entamoeba invadens IP1]|uniref:DOCKER domain-containing protein n=1 Tax=Entamoeba invadens IP1 TaxID=370355 RepID=A0A0A1TVT9_ENTIV|nr:hypothetical protein EIN_171920 [Entamoeba invadens IP1]ELP84597.1 hypothetical protein EIN_171920 [Entamoeba invadens IP1]|eukprot:XP_004183943.1 hypothetical protein EIN_171920 [Entamoeba invadens IP1]